MSSALLVWLSWAAGQEAPSVRELSDEVAELAARVAEARAHGESRAAVSAAMAAYREKAEELEQALASASDAERDARERARAEAARRLAEATAKGTADPDARAVLVEWLGDPTARLDALASAWAQAASDPVLGPSLRVDLEEQASTVGLVASYDAAQADAVARRDRDRAAAIRARGHTGAPPTLEMLAEAERLEREAAAAGAERDREAALAARAAALRATLGGGGP